MSNRLRTALQLGRVSNLPTVWTDVLAGVALGGARPTARVVVPVAIALSLAYVGGMYLNDAFDRGWDTQHRATRPIPAGQVSARTVFIAGFALLGAALLILLFGPGDGRAFAPGLVLAGLIVLYNIWHKGNPIAPLLMGLCRVSVYVIAARAAAATMAPALPVGAAFLLVYLIALSAVARRETKNPRLPALVSWLIAGIALCDGAQLFALGWPGAGALCVLAFGLTRLFQKRIAGT